MPLRIACHPGVTLEVIVADNRQGGTVASTASSSSGIHSISNTVDALRIAGAGTDNQALVIHSQSPTLETRMHHVSSQRHIALGSSQEDEPSNRVYTLTDGNATQQEQLHQMQQQIARALQEIQQTKELMHQLQQRADDIQQIMQQKDEQSTQKTLQLQQRIDDVHQTTLETDQHTSQRIEQIQQQMDDTLHKDQQTYQTIQLIRQQLDDIVQKLGQMEQTHEEDKDGDQQETPSEQKTHRNATQDLGEALLQQRLSFDRLLSIRSRVQALLAQSFQESPVPRLFIVLPKATGLVGQDGRLFFSRFRLYFLCECGAHTMNKNSKKVHKVHLAYHTGYDLNNHNAFFDKYGPYLLTMMYMVKYGAISSGRVVPPLLDLKADRFGFSMKDIGRLADDMIMYLEDAICTNSGDNDPTFGWELDPLELAQLKSYLKADEDENVFGSLCHTKTPDRYSVWICNKHQREYHESTLVTLHQIKEAIMANDGEYIEEQNKTTIRITSGKLAKRFLEAMKIVHWIYNPNDQWLLKGLGQELGCRYSVAMSIAHILIDHNITDSLVLDFGRFSLSTSISQEGTRTMELKVEKLSNLALDDLTSIFECLHNQLMIVNTPQEADEDRLISILQHSAKLEVLRIGCKANRSLAVINLIISTRKKFLQRGSPLSLQSFELMDVGPVPINIYGSLDTYGHITSTLKFSKDAKAFDMFADVKFPNSSSEYGPVLEFVRNYGWTVEKLVASSLLNIDHAEIILGAIRDRGSRITTLDIVPVAISADGYNTLDEIIKMSPNLVSLGLWCPFLGIKSAVGRTVATISRYKDRLHILRLSGTSIENWLPRIGDAFPTRDIFPNMCGLSITGHYGNTISGDCVRWIVAMVSAPTQSSSATPSLEPLARLKRLILSVALGPEDWKSVIRSIDMTELEWLEFKGSNFSRKELELLVHQFVGNDTSPARLRTLCIDNKLLEQEDVRALCATLREKLPQIEIK